MAFLNPSITFNGAELRSLSEAIITALVDKPELTSIHTIIPGIVAKQQIAILGRLRKITKLDGGCGVGATTPEIPATQKFWEPVQVKMWLKYCHTDFDASFMVYLKNKGKDVADITNTDIADFIIDLMGDAAYEDIYRIAWFSDKSAANVSGGGTIRNTVPLGDYNIIDGFWKQLFAIVSGAAARRVTITENAAASFALQDTFVTADKPATNYFRNLVTHADPRLKGASDKLILATTSLLDQYAIELESQNLDASYQRIEGGYSTLKIRGIEIVGMPTWDATIREDIQNGTVYNRPHRALFTTKSNIQLAVDEASALQDFDVFYDKPTEMNHFKGAYKVDAKIVEDHMVQVAY